MTANWSGGNLKMSAPKRPNPKRLGIQPSNKLTTELLSIFYIKKKLKVTREEGK